VLSLLFLEAQQQQDSIKHSTQQQQMGPQGCGSDGAPAASERLTRHEHRLLRVPVHALDVAAVARQHLFGCHPGKVPHLEAGKGAGGKGIGGLSKGA
jgi:hypothetical protein